MKSERSLRTGDVVIQVDVGGPRSPTEGGKVSAKSREEQSPVPKEGFGCD
jgi:hypothetical protein